MRISSNKSVHIQILMNCTYFIVFWTAFFEQKTSQRYDAVTRVIFFAVIGDGEGDLASAQHLAFLDVDGILFVFSK